MFRFFIKQKIEDPQNIVLTDKEAVHKIVKVLRLKPGDFLSLFDNEASEYEVAIKSITKKEVFCSFINKSFTSRDLEVEINLYQALLKKDKLEWLCQKVTELGVRKIIPLITENCVVKELNQNKSNRYQKIIEEATLQSGGKIPPVFSPSLKFEQAISQLNPQYLNVVAHEEEKDNQLLAVLGNHQAKVINIFIGPEGGFSPFEIELAKRNSVTMVGLGSRILRAETAAIVACAVVAQTVALKN